MLDLDINSSNDKYKASILIVKVKVVAMVCHKRNCGSYSDLCFFFNLPVTDCLGEVSLLKALLVFDLM